MGIHVVQAPLDLLAVLIKTRIVVLIIMTDVKVEAKAVEGAKQVSWFDPTLKDLLARQYIIGIYLLILLHKWSVFQVLLQVVKKCRRACPSSQLMCSPPFFTSQF